MGTNGTEVNGYAAASALTPATAQAVNGADYSHNGQRTTAQPLMARAQLYQKIAKVYEAVKYIQKDKRNTFHGYNYASESAIKAALHEAFATAGLILLPPQITDVKDEIRTGEKDKQTYLTTIRIRLEIGDIETGETVGGEIYGRGIDNQDKGIYKALTGALKYWLTTTFLIATGDDPEEDTTSNQEAPPPRRSARSQSGPPAPRPQSELNAAANIDTGGHPIGTQAAADYVAQQKLAAAERPWRTLAEAKRIILQLREKVGETPFLTLMERYRFRTVNDFDPRRPNDVLELYRALMFLSDGEAA